MRRFFWKALAIGLILLFLTPIPGGTVFLAMGLSMLICASLPFALFLQRVRIRFGLADRGFRWIENKLGERWAGNLMYTRPDADPREHFLRHGCDTSSTKGSDESHT